MATNSNLTEQVANLTTKLSAKDDKIKALQRILDELTATIQAFSMASMMQQPGNLNMMQQTGNPNIIPNMPMYNNAHPVQAFNPNAFLPPQQQSKPNNRFGQYQRRRGGRGQTRNRNGGRGQGRNTGRQQQLYYCWTCGANRSHTGTNCQNLAQGHIPNATFTNMQGGSTRSMYM
eukprot:8173477-Ditylum_brightwellii.AAC.1